MVFLIGGKMQGEALTRVVEDLCEPNSYEKVYFRDTHEVAMPSVDSLRKVMTLLRAVFFPGYFQDADLTPETMPYYIGSYIDKVARSLSEQLSSGFCVACYKEDSGFCTECHNRSKEAVVKFIAALPGIREMLAQDVQAAFEGDPASKSYNEIIYCYPSIRALTSYRVAHQLYLLGVPLLPRIITEMAHSETGIDIHPGARIKRRFFIDHGTGTVIGETCEIGENVRIYQGVTLGAKSFPLDEKGNPIKGIPRHPIVEDNVTIYSGTTILGRVTIGDGSVIGGNVWITQDVPPGTLVTQRQPRQNFIKNSE
jgi:serine O-acetyltransferase